MGQTRTPGETVGARVGSDWSSPTQRNSAYPAGLYCPLAGGCDLKKGYWVGGMQRTDVGTEMLRVTQKAVRQKTENVRDAKRDEEKQTDAHSQRNATRHGDQVTQAHG